MMLPWVVPVFCFLIYVYTYMGSFKNSFSFECLTILCGTCDSGLKKVAVMVCTIQPPLETTVVSDCRILLPTM